MAGTRLQVVSCFTLFALCLAPFAWHLTQVERVELPVEAIQTLAWNTSRFARPEHFQVTIWMKNPNDENVVKLTSERVHVQGEALKLSEKQQGELRGLRFVQEVDNWLETTLPARAASEFAVVLLCDDTVKIGDAAVVVGKYRHAFSKACSLKDAALQESVRHLVQNHVFPVEASERDNRRARVAARYRLQFSLLGSPPKGAWKWEYEAWYKRYLHPFVHKMRHIADFTTEQQIVHYAGIANAIHQDTEHGVYYVDAEDLKQFKSANDFLPATVVEEREQVLHFMSAIPDADQTPLVIKGANDERLATSFEIPSWGIVTILNPQKLVNSETESAEMRRLAGIFLTELRVLLGLPQFVSRQREENLSHRGSLQFLASPVDAVAQWELDVVTRKLVHRHVHDAIETLQSTVGLVTDMTQMSVLPHVEKRISKALELVQDILCDTGDTCDASDSEAVLVLARQASEEADAAYYDHTMVRQLYFPQEQLLGVYAPLLGPLFLPFIAGWIREWKRWRAKQREQQKAKSEAEAAEANDTKAAPPTK